MTSYQIPPPAPMSLQGDVVQNWKEFESAWEDYVIATELNGKLKKADGSPDPDGKRVVAATLCAIMGPDCKRILLNLPTITEAERKIPEEVIKGLRDYFVPQRNILYERFVFNSTAQKPGETIDQFVMRLRQLAESCEFGDLRDQLIRDRIVIGTTDEIGRERLLRERPVPDLEKAIQNLRAAEMSRSHKQAMSGKVSSVDHLNPSGNRGPGRQRAQGNPRRGQGHQKATDSSRPKKSKCNWCGKVNSPHSRRDCPAKDSTCNKCEKRGHWANVCRSVSADEIQGNDVEQDHLEEESEPVFLGEVIETIEDNFWSADIKVNSKATTFKLDTGSKICVVGSSTPWTKHLDLRHTDARFKGPGGVTLDHLIVGVIPQAELIIDNQTHHEDVYVMKNQKKNLLSKTAIQKLQLLKPASPVYAVEQTTNFRSEFPTLFKGLGCLKEEYKISLRKDATPVCLYTPRRVPHPLLPKVKDQLQKMLKSGVISQVSEPTEWCSGMVVVPKSSGDLRVCVDLTPLNKAVQREIHPMASVDENLAKVQGSQFFTKLDANSGFWQIPLHPESRLLTTFITPFGRFCFNRLPFGISSAPEIFQRQMSRTLEDLEGVICHMDDILVHAPTQETHDSRVRAVLTRLQEAGATLNEKCEFSKKRLTFLGHIVSPDGVAVDPKKTQAIKEFPAPTNITELQRFNGMVNQLAKFLPNLAQINEPLRQLLRKDTSWVWDTPQETSFQEIKAMLTSTSVLAHYDPKAPSIVAADASQYGLGAVLLQKDAQGDRRPICFASRSLSDTEKNYAVIEKEALAATWACEKFRDYVLGTKFTLQTDHRPLVPLLSSTNLSKLPARILRFRLRLMRYTPDVEYIQGKHQKTADALSHAPVCKPGLESSHANPSPESRCESSGRVPSPSHKSLSQVNKSQVQVIVPSPESSHKSLVLI